MSIYKWEKKQLNHLLYEYSKSTILLGYDTEAFLSNWSRHRELNMAHVIRIFWSP